VNTFGKGRAYYIASRNEPRFQADLYGRLIDDLRLRRALGRGLPDGVTAQVRTDGTREWIFLLGFNREAVTFDLGTARYRDRIGGRELTGRIRLEPYGVHVLEREVEHVER
jgi:beta-galactosidase